MDDQTRIRATCIICQDIFNDPRELDCQHTFCLPCLCSRQPLRMYRNCPVCRMLTIPPAYLCERLPSNSMLNRLAKSVRRQQVYAPGGPSAPPSYDSLQMSSGPASSTRQSSRTASASRAYLQLNANKEDGNDDQDEDRGQILRARAKKKLEEELAQATAELSEQQSRFRESKDKIQSCLCKKENEIQEQLHQQERKLMDDLERELKVPQEKLSKAKMPLLEIQDTLNHDLEKTRQTKKFELQVAEDDLNHLVKQLQHNEKANESLLQKAHDCYQQECNAAAKRHNDEEERLNKLCEQVEVQLESIQNDYNCTFQKAESLCNSEIQQVRERMENMKKVAKEKALREQKYEEKKEQQALEKYKQATGRAYASYSKAREDALKMTRLARNKQLINTSRLCIIQ